MKKKLLIFSFLFTVILMGCGKEGCTDPKSINFDEKAKRNSGICRYEGKVVFWYDAETGSKLQSLNATFLHFYIDDEFVGSSSTSNFKNSVPPCDLEDESLVVKLIEMGSSSSKVINYTVKDQDGYDIWKASERLVGGVDACLVIPLEL
jgi:hypothetical protein